MKRMKRGMKRKEKEQTDGEDDDGRRNEGFVSNKNGREGKNSLGAVCMDGWGCGKGGLS